jgi:23S rRNA (uracil1939-C5)-methyltransferase
VVFVRGVLPGDRILARIYKKKKDYAEASFLTLLEPSPDRVEAPCPYSGYCGGCQWQFVKYASQLRFKRQQIQESFEHIGGLKQVRVCEVIPSDRQFGYRNKMEFSFSDRRWWLPHEWDGKTDREDFALGLHVPGTYNKIIDMEACLLQEETGNAILREVRRYVRNSRVPVYSLKTHKGFWRFLTIRYSFAFDHWMVNVVTSEARTNLLEPLVELLGIRYGRLRTVVNNISRKKAAVALGDREIVLLGKGFIRDKIGAYAFQISANSFFQTNARSAEHLYNKVLEYAELTGRETVLDLYSGTGTIPVFLAARARAVTGLEIIPDAVMDARKNCEENQISNCRFICGDIREKLCQITETPDVLVVDPPRAGMHPDVLRRVMAMAPKRVIYISCNPATLARDIGEMSPDYELLEVQPVDMFPNTYHVECIANLRRPRKIG